MTQPFCSSSAEVFLSISTLRARRRAERIVGAKGRIAPPKYPELSPPLLPVQKTALARGLEAAAARFEARRSRADADEDGVDDDLGGDIDNDDALERMRAAVAVLSVLQTQRYSL